MQEPKENILRELELIINKVLGLSPTSTEYNRMIIALEALKQKIIRRSYQRKGK